jgi:hypothetical protein
MASPFCRFGLTEPRVLQLLEALPEAEACEGFQYVEERSSWKEEAALMSRGKQGLAKARK